VDARLRGQSFVIEYRPKLGFGLSSTPSEGLGEGPDEFLEDEEAVRARIAALVSSRRRTEPQRVRFLQELRERQHVSQVALADKLGVRQPTILEDRAPRGRASRYAAKVREGIGRRAPHYRLLPPTVPSRSGLLLIETTRARAGKLAGRVSRLRLALAIGLDAIAGTEVPRHDRERPEWFIRLPGLSQNGTVDLTEVGDAPGAAVEPPSIPSKPWPVAS